MGFSLHRRVDAIHLSCILWLFFNVWRLESVRPLDTEATPKVQQNASFVEVGTRHFSLAKSLEKELASSSESTLPSQNGRIDKELGSKETHGVKMPNSVHQGTQDLNNRDEWESRSDEWEDAGQEKKDPLGDTGDNAGAETGPMEEQMRAVGDPNAPNDIEGIGKPPDTGGTVAPYEYQTPPEGENVERDPSLTPGVTTGNRKLDALGEEDTMPIVPPPEEDGITPPKEGTNLLYVPPGPELSHEERDEMLGRGEDLSEVDKRNNHFQEVLHHKPVVVAAVENYKKGINKLKETTKDIYNELDLADKKFGQFNYEVNAVQNEVGHTKRSLHSESREAAVQSVNSFANYNKEGAAGSDVFGKWVPDAGKWNVFKDLIDEGTHKLENGA